MFFIDGKPRPFMRLGFARLAERELDEAVSHMVAALGAPEKRLITD
jgi:DNA-binding transcriptional MocR family regulator